MKMNISFPGNKKVNAVFKDFEVKTDQPKAAGGDGSAPSPFELFLSSMGTCAGIFAISFFQNRNLSTEGFELSLDFKWNDKEHRLEKVNILVTLPKNFPEKYVKPLIDSINLCSVKKTIQNPPEFETVVNKS